MRCRVMGGNRRGWVARAWAVWACLLLAGCATTPNPRGELAIRPDVQHQTTSQVVGDAVVASLGGATVTVRWLAEADAARYYAARPGLVDPWPPDLWKESPPTIFLLRVRNTTPGELQFDPGMVSLVAPSGQPERTIPYEEMYMRLSETKDSGARLVSLQATMFSRFVVIQPGGEREGLLVFRELGPKVKHVLLELSSFFVEGRAVPGLFEFQVSR